MMMTINGSGGGDDDDDHHHHHHQNKNTKKKQQRKKKNARGIFHLQMVQRARKRLIDREPERLLCLVPNNGGGGTCDREMLRRLRGKRVGRVRTRSLSRLENAALDRSEHAHVYGDERRREHIEYLTPAEVHAQMADGRPGKLVSAMDVDELLFFLDAEHDVTRAASNFWAFVESEQQVMMYLTYVPSAPAIFVHYFAVHPQHRRQGVGRVFCATLDVATSAFDVHLHFLDVCNVTLQWILTSFTSLRPLFDDDEQQCHYTRDAFALRRQLHAYF